MLQNFQNRIISAIHTLDIKIEEKLYRILPRDLKKRYILGLGSLALLVIVAQVLEQAELRSQYYTFSQLRQIDSQINYSDHLMRLFTGLRRGISPVGLDNDLKKIDAILNDMQRIQGLITGDDNFSAVGTRVKNSYTGYYSLTNSLLAKILQRSSELKRISAKEFSHAVEIINADTETFLTSMQQLERYSEMRLDARMERARRVGTFSLFVILLLLFIEALYVFRPSVKQLLEALEARTKFLSTMGHEIRNPMNSILGMTRLLKDTKLSDQQKRYISVLSSSSHSLMGLLNNLIDYSKINAGKVVLQYFDFNILEQIQDTIDLVTYKIDEKKLNFIFEVDRDLPVMVMSDPVIIQQVLLNLLSNAVKFTDQGDITLKVWQEMREGFLQLNFQISDTGIGIRQDKLTEVFEYFRQEDSNTLANYGGSGLGLSISAELVRLMGGNIEIQSKKGEGSRFQFHIPVKQFSSESIGEVFEKKRMRGACAFLADSHEQRQFILSSYIKMYGGDFVAATKSAKTNAEWSAYFRKEEFDVYILNYDDFSDFIDLLVRVQAETKRNLLSKVVVLVRSTLPSSKLVELNSIGVKIFLYLPIKPLEFLNTMDLVFTAKRHVRAVEKERTAERHYQVELAKMLRVLIVDDSKDNQFLMKSYIERNASHVVFAGNGLDAVEKFKQEPFDIVFMDILMPKMDGYDATKEIRDWERAQNKTPTPVVAVTAHTGEEVLKKCWDAGITAHFGKPVDLGELQSFLIKIFGRKQEQVQMSELQLIWQQKLKEYLPIYYKQREEDVKNLKAAVEAEDWPKITSIGHKIKGSAATYGFPELGEMGADLEKSASQKDLAIIHSRITSMENWLSEVTHNH